MPPEPKACEVRTRIASRLRTIADYLEQIEAAKARELARPYRRRRHRVALFLHMEERIYAKLRHELEFILREPPTSPVVAPEVRANSTALP